MGFTKTVMYLYIISFCGLIVHFCGCGIMTSSSDNVLNGSLYLQTFMIG